MLVIRSTALLTAGLLLADPLRADDRPEHFQGEPSPTLSAAMSQLDQYNRQLAALLASDELTNERLHQIHVLTYTLENALARLEESVDTMQDSLEEVHQGSERADPDKVKTQGQRYLDLARQLGNPE